MHRARVLYKVVTNEANDIQCQWSNMDWYLYTGKARSMASCIITSRRSTGKWAGESLALFSSCQWSRHWKASNYHFYLLNVASFRLQTPTLTSGLVLEYFFRDLARHRQQKRKTSSELTPDLFWFLKIPYSSVREAEMTEGKMFALLKSCVIDRHVSNLHWQTLAILSCYLTFYM